MNSNKILIASVFGLATAIICLVMGLYLVFVAATITNTSTLVTDQTLEYTNPVVTESFQSVAFSSSIKGQNGATKNTSKSESLSSSISSATTTTATILNEYRTYQKVLEQVVEDSDPKVALLKLNEDIFKIPVAQEYCHSLTHIVGNAALKKYNNSLNEAVKYYVDICGGGYLHGVIEKYIEIDPDAKTAISKVCGNPQDGICYHAVGHGFMLLNNYDVPLSVDNCRTLPTKSQEVWCGEGVFMENFDSENAKDDDKPYLKSSDPFYPCNEFNDLYRDVCYYYSGRYIFKLTKDPYQSLQKCYSPQTSSNTCIRGMAAGILRSDLFNPSKMEVYCNSVPNNKKGCLEGAVNYYLLMLDSGDKAKKEMCDLFQNNENRKLCSQLVESSPFAK